MVDPVAAVAAHGTTDSITFWVAFWPAFWPAVLGAVAGSGAAFSLEFLRRRREQRQQEVGKGNRLLLTLTQILSTLEDLYEPLFERFAREKGHHPEWHEVGMLSGLPQDAPTIVLAEYEFMLQDAARGGDVPGVLNRLWILDRNYRSIVNIIHERNGLFMQFKQSCPPGVTDLGDAGLRDMATAKTYIERLKELTAFLENDLAEAIESARISLTETRTMLRARYPQSEFLLSWPKGGISNPV